jgi:hypothetical protein
MVSRRRAPGATVYHHRVARIYDSRDGISTIFVVKPDFNRYWTRTMGLCDADEVALDFFRWQHAADFEDVDRQ